MAGLLRIFNVVILTAIAAPCWGMDNGGNESALPKKERIISSRLSGEIAASLPKFDATKPAAAVSSAAGSPTEPRNTIVRLPTYIVREARPPAETDVLTTAGWEADAAKRYLGPKGNLDRTLNAVTLTGLWKKIPVLGRIPFVPFGSLNDGQRAQFIYERVEAKRRFTEIMDMGTVAPEPAKSAAPVETKP